MGTRSTIALEFADGTVEQVYCHWDGYLENNGAILAEHYMDPFKLRELIDLGDVSSLGPVIGYKHAFSRLDTEMPLEEYETLYGNMTTFYGRDRSESGCGAKRFANIAEYVQMVQREEYDYILRNVNGQPEWFVRFYATGDEWVMLSAAVGVDQHSDVD